MKFYELFTPVLAAVPVCATSTSVTGSCVNMENYETLVAFVTVGALAGACTAIAYECSGSDGKAPTAIGFSYTVLTSGALSGSLLTTPTTAASTGYDFTATGDNQTLIMEVNSDDLDETKPYVEIVVKPTLGAYTTILYTMIGGHYKPGFSL